MCCNGQKNHTPDVAFQALKAKGVNFRSEEVKGVGLFVVPAPELGILEYRTVTVDGLSYSECMKRGANCESFQWLPFGVTFETKGRALRFERLEDLEGLRGLCDESCRGGCPFGCVCFSGDVQCQSNN